MGSRTLNKFFFRSRPELLCCQEKKPCIFNHLVKHSNSRINTFDETYQHQRLSQEELKESHKVKSSIQKRYNDWSYKLKPSSIQCVLFPNVNTDILFLKHISPLQTKQNTMFLKLKYTRVHHFSTSSNKDILSKLIPHANYTQVPIKLYTHKAEAQHLMIEGVGWAGQPIVKRIHPILPEVYGDVCDIFHAEKEQLSPSQELESVITSQDGIDNTEQTSDLSGSVDGGTKNDYTSSTLNENEELESLGEVNSQVKNDDIVAVIEDSEQGNKLASLKGNVIFPLNKNNEIQLQEKVRKERKHCKKEVLNTAGMLIKTKKIKRKKTKICNSLVNSSQVKKKKKNKSKVFGINKKNKLYTNLILNQRAHQSQLSPPNNFLLMENRQIKTDSTLNYPKLSVEVSVKERASQLIVATKGAEKKSTKEGTLSSKKAKKENLAEDNCVCPETLVVKRKRKTKICGQAKGVDDINKKKKWKGKMCLVEPQAKYKRKTFVCAPKIKKDKRKRQLPKCPKPEKKPVPRVEVCPPVLIEETKEKAKRCVKQEEEVKTRQRTTVCRPVIIYGREQTEIKVEKSVCVDTSVKKARHTKICPPPVDDKSRKKSLRKH